MNSRPLPLRQFISWSFKHGVLDGRAAETAAHKALAKYRLASNREFFIGSYSTLREKIEAAINEFVFEMPSS